MTTAAEAAWSPREIDLAAALWKDGASAQEIAQALWQRLESYRSRSAVLGLMARNRERFPHRGTGVRRVARSRADIPKPERPRRASVPAVKPPPAPRQQPAEDLRHLRAPTPPRRRTIFKDPHAYDAASRHVPLVDLRSGDCRFPVNNAALGEAHLFCGLQAAPDAPYCAHHAARACDRSTMEGA